jgi:hypothetical protein
MGPGRVAQVDLGNGLTQTLINKDSSLAAWQTARQSGDDASAWNADISVPQKRHESWEIMASRIRPAGAECKPP